MKRLAFLITACLGLMLAISCEKSRLGTGDITGSQPLTLSLPDGTTYSMLVKSDEGEGTDGKSDLAFRNATFQYPSDIEGCVFLSAFTNGRMVHDSFFMSLYLKADSLSPGKEPEFERILFCLPLSSYSGARADTFKGHIYIKEQSSEQIVLRFKKTVFELSGANYTLNGDLVYTKK